jgi:glutathione synthase/RimK-type ligase-like ATP-grasp enzyme
MRLLKITDRDEGAEELDEYFDEVEGIDIEDVAPEVSEGRSDIKVDDGSVERFDAVYASIPRESAIFGRVLLEIIEEKDVALNYSSTAFFTMSKKNYLYHVMQEKDIPAPKTAVVADEKAARNLENHLKGPLVARKFDGLSEVESTKIDTVEGIQEFAEGVEYGESILIFNELSKGEKYRCLVAGDTVISLEDTSEGWRFSPESLKYSSLSSDLREVVEDAAHSLGTRTAEILLRDGKVVDVNPNPDLEMYTDISGKDAYGAVAEALKGDEE